MQPRTVLWWCTRSRTRASLRHHRSRTPLRIDPTATAMAAHSQLHPDRERGRRWLTEEEEEEEEEAAAVVAVAAATVVVAVAVAAVIWVKVEVTEKQVVVGVAVVVVAVAVAVVAVAVDIVSPLSTVPGIRQA